MDFFKPGSVSIKMVKPDGSLSDVDSLPDFLTNAAGESATTCDCPPGCCPPVDAEAFEGTLPDFLSAMFGGEPGEDGYDDNDDFGVVDEDEERIMAIEATAQLGRIVEGLTEVVSVHAGLLKQLVG